MELKDKTDCLIIPAIEGISYVPSIHFIFKADRQEAYFERIFFFLIIFSVKGHFFSSNEREKKSFKCLSLLWKKSYLQLPSL